MSRAAEAFRSGIGHSYGPAWWDRLEVAVREEHQRSERDRLALLLAPGFLSTPMGPVRDTLRSSTNHDSKET